MVVAAAPALVACGVELSAPPRHVDDARFGRIARAPAEGVPQRDVVCPHWEAYFQSLDPYALSHTSFPETDVQDSCYVPVEHDQATGTVRPAAEPARGCAYPDEAGLARIDRLAGALERRDRAAYDELFSCPLTTTQKDAAARHNARVLRSLAARARAGGSWPYAAVVTPGHGLPEQAACALAQTLPDAPCSTIGPEDMVRLGGNVPRTERAVAAVKGGVAPIVIASGGAIHSCMVEAFAIAQLATCTYGLEDDRVLVEPCAQHTHTNLRNAGRWMVAMGARTGYLLTDDFIQSRYFEDFTGFEFLLGSVDQRSLRDFGFIIGSWRLASRGIRAGFWFTPYRFWAEPKDELGSLTCVDW